MRFKQFLKENHYGSLVDQDTYKSLNTADKALYKYTADGFTPLDDVIDKLVKKYPYDGGTIYRGLHFDNKEQHDEFLESIKDGVIDTSGPTSWSPNEGTAEDFARTKKTYFADYGIMVAHKKMQDEGEYMPGYGGVLIATTVGEGVGVDVSKSDFAKESEVILKPGRYEVKIVRLKEPFKRKYGTKESIDELIQQFKNAPKTAELDELLNYVKKSWGDKLTTEQFDIIARYELSKFLKFKPEQMNEFTTIEIRDYENWGDKKQKQIVVDIWVPFYYSEIENCSAPLKAKIVKQIKYIAAGAKEKIKAIEKHPDFNKVEQFNIRGITALRDFDKKAADEIAVPLRKLLSTRYHEMNSRETSLTLKDVWDIRKHGEKIAELINAMQKL